MASVEPAPIAPMPTFVSLSPPTSRPPAPLVRTVLSPEMSPIVTWVNSTSSLVETVRVGTPSVPSTRKSMFLPESMATRSPGPMLAVPPLVVVPPFCPTVISQPALATSLTDFSWSSVAACPDMKLFGSKVVFDKLDTVPAVPSIVTAVGLLPIFMVSASPRVMPSFEPSAVVVRLGSVLNLISSPKAKVFLRVLLTLKLMPLPMALVFDATWLSTALN